MKYEDNFDLEETPALKHLKQLYSTNSCDNLHEDIFLCIN